MKPGRDRDYIESRLLAPCEGALEAYGRLRECGADDKADKLMEAMAAFTDATRAIRLSLLPGQGGHR